MKIAQSLLHTWTEEASSSHRLSWIFFDSVLRNECCCTCSPLSPEQMEGNKQGFRSGHPLICKVQLTTAKTSPFAGDFRRRHGDPFLAKRMLKKRTFTILKSTTNHCISWLPPKCVLHPSFRAVTTYTTSLHMVILQNDKSLSASLENVLLWLAQG